jgi:hypothetical protein
MIFVTTNLMAIFTSKLIYNTMEGCKQVFEIAFFMTYGENLTLESLKKKAYTPLIMECKKYRQTLC